ncbi:MAG TPA: hypothetical protein VFR03_05800 [Thermoanaerobaculia bacterium]|nr:hypothetical protein [Thermoanaerobaculia bacterium]
MSSKKPDLLNLERDIPVTLEDVQALRKNRPRTGEDWLNILTRMYEQVPNTEELRQKRRTFEGCEPFEL